MTPDIQTILDRGSDASGLLENPAFIAVMNDMSNWHVAAMVASPEGPEGADARDHHHRMTFALRELHDALQGHVTASAELRQRLNIQEAEDNPAADMEDFDAD